MKPASVKELRQALNNCSDKELATLCLHLSKFKKENKEFLTYLLFESGDENAYVESIKKEIDEQFEEINTRSYFYIKKSIRKILKNIKKYIRFSKKKDTEAEILLHFCARLRTFSPSIRKNQVLKNMYDQQAKMIKKAVSKLHEDLQYDYEKAIEKLDAY